MSNRKGKIKGKTIQSLSRIVFWTFCGFPHPKNRKEKEQGKYEGKIQQILHGTGTTQWNS